MRFQGRFRPIHVAEGILSIWRDATFWAICCASQLSFRTAQPVRAPATSGQSTHSLEDAFKKRPQEKPDPGA
jgi:hypothetical protein